MLSFLIRLNVHLGSGFELCGCTFIFLKNSFVWNDTQLLEHWFCLSILTELRTLCSVRAFKLTLLVVAIIISLCAFCLAMLSLCRLYYIDAVEFYVHVTVHRNKFLFNKTNKRTNFSKFIFVKKLYMFRAVLLSIIRSSSLYIWHWYMSSNLHGIYQCQMYSGELLMMDRRTARNM
jgi:hypothetical protein